MFLWLICASGAVADDVLPVRRVRFYETGVAWFERAGRTSGSTSLPVPTSHLDDALKSLVVLGGDVDVGAITFSSAVGDRAARSDAGLGGTGQVAFADALDALTGVRVTVTLADDRRIDGVLLDVEGPLPRATSEQGGPDALAPQYALTLLDDDGRLTRANTDAIVQVQSDEADVTDRLARAVRTLTRTGARRPNALNVQTHAGAELALGYLAEAPVWRVTYRIVGPDGGKARLQAWGLVHNDTDEDWARVSVEIANGEPDSFLYPLAAPRYAQRALRTPPRTLSTVAQLSATTADALWTSSDGGTSGFGSGSGSFGYGSAGGSVASRVADTPIAALKEAEAVQTPTQFVYTVARPLDLAAHHSALVPLVHAEVPTEPTVVFAPGSTAGRTGVWLYNGSERTLPRGVVSVLEAGGLAGETTLERMRVDESQMLLFGNELDVDLDRTSTTAAHETTALGYATGALQLTQMQATTHALAIHNRSGRDRALWLALPLGSEAEVVGPVRTEIDRQTGWTWVVFHADEGEAERQIRVESISRERRAPEDVHAETYRAWATAALADPDVLGRAADRRERIARTSRQLAELTSERARAQAQAERLRSDLRAAEGGDGTGALARQVANIEAEIRRLSQRMEDGQRDHEDAKAALRAVLATLEDGASTASDRDGVR